MRNEKLFKFFVRYLELAFPLWRTTRIHAIILKPFFQYLISIWTRIQACRPVFGRPVMVSLCNDGDWNLAFLFFKMEIQNPLASSVFKDCLRIEPSMRLTPVRNQGSLSSVTQAL